ncbi:MAG: spore protease YyaC [Bacilli bacterium]
MNKVSYYEVDFFTCAFTTLWRSMKDIPPNRIHILCIGSDTSTGDSFGPLVGSYLKNNGSTFPIYGTLQQPVHALNLVETYNTLMKYSPSAFIIAIDASIGKVSLPGTFLISNAPLFPGSSLKKNLPGVGHLSIECIVTQANPGECVLTRLQSCSLFNTLSYAHALGNLLLRIEEQFMRKKTH